ncbi:histidine kinase [Nocardioides sp.]|uniref:sensor histidine kinase n=1 Tax=Nocardioides sp. TaxID=35761 RepID=UPI00286DDADC|nr:histidine kinase [Nocardioides sp.]
MVALNAWFVPLQLAVALYTVATTSRRRFAVLIGIASIIAVGAAEATESHVRPGDIAWRVVFLAAAWLLGDSIGSRRAYVHELEEKADRLEREQEAQARRAAAEEQARIARELHDIVAHALSVIAVQAAAAEDALEDEPSPAREPVAAIATVARSALGDLRRVVGALREGAAELEPQPTIRQLGPLVERVRSAGLPVALDITGDSRPLAAAVELSAYRIVQEALTNTLKHAGATQVRVLVRYGERLELEIRDNGSRPSNGASNGTGRGSPHGNGLIGMRERVTMLGGDLSATPSPGGGFVVRAQIPIERA